MSSKCGRIFTLNEANAPRINPALASEIGLNESIILLQIEYWISISSNFEDGRKWTYQSVRDMRKKSFSFWSIATINRAINKLINEGYLIEGNYNKLKYDNTRWFALNFEKLEELNSITVRGHETHSNQNETGVYQNETHSNQNETHSAQNDTTIPKTTTKITTENTTHTTEDIEKVMCVLDKKINFVEAKKLLKISNGDIEIIKEKYEVAKVNGYKTLMGFMTDAIREDWQMPKSQQGASKEKKTDFHNFGRRTDKYTPEELERIVLRR